MWRVFPVCCLGSSNRGKALTIEQGISRLQTSMGMLRIHDAAAEVGDLILIIPTDRQTKKGRSRLVLMGQFGLNSLR